MKRGKMPEREINQEYRGRVYFKIPDYDGVHIAYAYSETLSGVIARIKELITQLKENNRKVTRVTLVHTTTDLISYSPEEFEDVR